jgi:hypothetical protein
MAVQIQLRNGTAAQWTAANPTLAAGEVGIESDTRKQKFGDGTTAWNSLSYAGGSGTVTGVTGTSPVASSGGTTPAISLSSAYGDTLNPYASKTANQVLAAPNGTAGVPSFRALVSADIPTLNQNTTGTAAGLSSTLAVSSGGTGQTTYTDGQLLIGNSTGNTLSKATLTAGSNVTITNGNGSITIAASGGGGGVTSVTGTSPVASSGGTTPAISLSSGYGDTLNPYASKTANYVLAAPNGSSGVPTFRAIVAGDIPTLNQNTTGTAAGLSTTLAVASGGTGLTSTPANGALDIGNGTGFTRTTLTAGSNVTITNGAGSITIAASGAGASAATPTALGTVYGITPSGTAAVAVGYQAATTTTSAVGVTAVGYQSLTANTAANNTAVGYQALYANSSGGNNIAIGYQALLANTTGGSNTCVGQTAGKAITSAVYNVCLGGYTGDALTTGSYNTFVGTETARTVTTGQKNLCLGDYTNPSNAAADSEFVLGYSVTGAGTQTATIGSNAGKIYNSYAVNATWTQTSDVRLKTNIQDDSLGLSFVNRLRPVKFNWKPSNEIDPSLPQYSEVNERNTTTVIHGLIAQEVKAALDAEGVNTFAGWDEGIDGTQAISREMFVSPLIKAIQELSAANEALTARIAALEAK